jgi:hypothetical protein
MVLIGGAEEWVAVQWERSMWENFFMNTPHYTFTLKMEIAMFVEMLVNTQHSTFEAAHTRKLKLLI